jgi:radical SAM superfamily enzyme YgiQ (UPF0313 family)
MNILLVRPRPDPETIGLQHVMIVEPLELEILAACAGPTHHCVIADMILDRRPFARVLAQEQPDVLCVTGYITNVPALIAYCEQAKARNPRVITVAGGVHCEVCPADLDHPAVDYRVVRNAATVFSPLLEAIRGHGATPAGVLRPGESLDTAVLPARDFTVVRPDRTLTRRDRHRYFYIFHDRVALLKTSFGCPHSCRFCFCKAITGGAYAQRPLDDVLEELAEITERDIYIVDDDFLADHGRLRDFIAANRTRHLDKQYLVYGRADFIARHPETMEAFAQAGLRTIIVGIESFFDDELVSYGKHSTAEVNREALAVLTRLGIDCYATVIVSPEWDRERFAECGRQLKAAGIHYVNLQPLTPLPGTGMSQWQEPLLLARTDYPRWDLAHVSLPPRHMSVAAFYREILTLYEQIVFQPSVLWEYLQRYRPHQWWQMARGSALVKAQYLRKIREAERRDG